MRRVVEDVDPYNIKYCLYINAKQIFFSMLRTVGDACPYNRICAIHIRLYNKPVGAIHESPAEKPLHTTGDRKGRPYNVKCLYNPFFRKVFGVVKGLFSKSPLKYKKGTLSKEPLIFN